MTFTYDITADVGKIRFEIGDTVLDKGVKPDNSNLLDEEIQMLLDREGTVLAAAAAACEALARAWSREVDYTIGPRKESMSQVAKAFSQQALSLREKTGTTGMAFSVGFNREDGYSLAENPSEYT